MKTHPRLFILILLGISLAGARAESFTPEDAAIFAVRHNKDLASARFMIAEAEGKLLQAGLWMNPEFSLGSQFNAQQPRSGDSLFSAEFMQKFPLAGRLAKAKAVARLDVAMAAEELRDKERMLAGDVLGKARSILIMDRKIQLNREVSGVLDRVIQQTKNLITTGGASAAEARVAEIERKMLELDRQNMDIQKQAMLAELNGMLGRGPREAFSLAGELPSPPSSSVLKTAADEATKRRPDYRLAALEIDKTRSEEVLARAERWEDVSIGLAGMRQHQTFDGEISNMNNTMVGVVVSVPVPIWNRNQGRIAEARAAQQRTMTALQARELAIATEVREAQIRVTGLAEVVAKTRGPAVDLARNNTKLLEDTFASGTIPFLMIFESQKQRLDLEKSALDSEEQLAASISAWETRTGYFSSRIRDALAAGHQPTNNRKASDKSVIHSKPH